MTENPSQVKTDSAGKPASLADMIGAEPQAPSFRQSFPPATCIKVLVLAGLFVWLNNWQFPALVRVWLDDPNWSHGFLIPLFSIYLIYNRWDEFVSARRRTCLWGLPILILAVIFIALG
ncbi:MAG: archaeosortase/exosortase family protein, partial [Planctomycetota bacterium]